MRTYAAILVTVTLLACKAPESAIPLTLNEEETPCVEPAWDQLTLNGSNGSDPARSGYACYYIPPGTPNVTYTTVALAFYSDGTGRMKRPPLGVVDLTWVKDGCALVGSSTSGEIVRVESPVLNPNNTLDDAQVTYTTIYSGSAFSESVADCYHDLSPGI